MPKILCTNPNASDSISGIAFEFDKKLRGMVSELVDQETAERFASIDGYQILEEQTSNQADLLGAGDQTGNQADLLSQAAGDQTSDPAAGNTETANQAAAADDKKADAKKTGSAKS